MHNTGIRYSITKESDSSRCYRRLYELSDHLGNVRVVVGDHRSGSGAASLHTSNQYYPFGLLQQGNGLNAGGYRFGFNGHEKDEEIGHGIYTAEFWEYDAKIGRRWNLDPVIKVHESLYACFANNPITYVDPDGRESIDAIQFSTNEGTVTQSNLIYDGTPGLNITIEDLDKGTVTEQHFEDIPCYGKRPEKKTETEAVTLPKSGKTLFQRMQGNSPYWNDPMFGGSDGPIKNAGIETKASLTYKGMEEAVKIKYNESSGSTETFEGIQETNFTTGTKYSASFEVYFYMQFNSAVTINYMQAPIKFNAFGVQLNFDPTSAIFKVGYSSKPSTKMELKTNIQKKSLFMITEN